MKEYPTEKRIRIVELVTSESATVREAARQLGVRPSTASALQAESVGMKAETTAKVQSLHDTIATLAHENALLKRKLYGNKTERSHTSEAQLALGDLLAAEQQLQRELDDAVAQAKVTVPTSETLFPRGLLHPSIVAQVITSKLSLGVPHYRLEQDLTDQGVPLDRGTMSRYVAQRCRFECPIIGGRSRAHRTLMTGVKPGQRAADPLGDGSALEREVRHGRRHAATRSGSYSDSSQVTELPGSTIDGSLSILLWDLEPCARRVRAQLDGLRSSEISIAARSRYRQRPYNWERLNVL